MDAACPNRDTIVIWEVETSNSDIANDMFRRSMFNIIDALSTVLPLEEVKQTKQFEICLLENL